VTSRGRDADPDQGRLRSRLRQAAARRRFQKGPVRQPARAPARFEEPDDLLNDTVTITENGRRRKITKGEAVIKQLVNKSASADPRSLKILPDLMLNLKARARSSTNPTPAVASGDEQVLAQLKARLEAAIQDSIATGESV
jgi:hypothetical protein